MKRPSHLLSAALAILTVCALPAAVMGAENPLPTKPAAADAPSANSASKPPMVTQNPDGTMTVQKQPPKGEPEATNQKGLVIPPQVIVTTIPPPDNKQKN